MRTFVRDGLVVVAAVVVAAIGLKSCVVEAYKIPTNSMSTTLVAGDYVLINKFIFGARTPHSLLSIPLPSFRFPSVRSVQRGDVVAFLHADRPEGVRKFVKRIAGLAGDTVRINDHVLEVNGEPYPYIGSCNEESYGPVVVPQRTLFMIGDNVNVSADSRDWGPVPEENVIGKAMIIYWSSAESIRWSRILSMVR